MDFETFRSIIIGGSIVTLKSDVLIQNIHTVEEKWNGIVIGGEVAITDGSAMFGGIRWESRWTTIPN
jgi:hypothetical protein